MGHQNLHLQTIFLISVVLVLFFATTLTHSLPLSTSSRWIVDDAGGRRVKLRCVNWAGHMEAMVAEGLDKRPIQDIARHVASLGFNCVRLTWATYMFTRAGGYANLTVAASLDSLGLVNAKVGIYMHNPSFLKLTLVKAQEVVVDELGKHGLMVVLDNHVSKPKWCCGNNDGNGFFGDMFFDPKEWLHGLHLVANRYRGKQQVVAMSMRNELRGPRQNVRDWYKSMKMGALKIHKTNPNLLVIVSGLNYDTNFRFFKNKSLESNLNDKLVYEAHWYSFGGERRKWAVQPLNRVCAETMNGFSDRVGFLIGKKKSVPLFLSEFGLDQRGVNRADNRFLTCLMGYVVERDLDWALWALQGSYYLKNGKAGPEDPYGMLDVNWTNLRNPKFQERFRLMQKMLQEPNSNILTHQIMYHPQSGHCIRVTKKGKIVASDCQKWSRLSHSGDGNPIRLMGTSRCLKAVGEGQPATISSDCSSQQSKWTFVSVSKLHIAARDEHGGLLCLEAKSYSNSSSILLTKRCICLNGEPNCLTNPQSQWFKLIFSNME